MIINISIIFYIFPEDFDVKDKENITTIMGIFNINRRLLEDGTIITNKQMDCIKYMNYNIDSSKALCISHKRQEEWKDNLIVNSKSHIMEYNRINDEIQDWNNGKYQYLVILNSKIYNYLKNEITLDETKLIFENEETKIFEKNI